ncbi:MAG TPA: NUDIX domain-containing protein [Nocardioidaceae bacterium]|nr:NUDIX domain-containing protein [Nocardioidaceae bacterium]
MSPWPSQVFASSVLVWEEDGRLLMVKTHSRSTLILPGGLVEPGESQQSQDIVKCWRRSV